jgi:hypothetical protein
MSKLTVNQSERIQDVYNAYGAASRSLRTVADKNAALGSLIDKSEKLQAFPLLLGNKGATYQSFLAKEDNPTAKALRAQFTEAQWRSAMDFLEGMREQHEAHLDGVYQAAEQAALDAGKTAKQARDVAEAAQKAEPEFKKILGGVKNNCKYRVGAEKSQAAKQRAEKDNIKAEKVKTSQSESESAESDATVEYTGALCIEVATAFHNALAGFGPAMQDQCGLAGVDPAQHVELIDAIKYDVAKLIARMTDSRTFNSEL